MKTKKHAFQTVPAALALAIAAAGAWTALPAAAQTRAALVQSVDEPARNPYQERIFGITCSGMTACSFNFAAVPAGKRLVITHISGFVDTATGVPPQGELESNLRGATNSAHVYFTGVRGLTGGALGTRYYFNQEVLAYFGAGETPNGSYFAFFDLLSGGAVMMVSGYYVNVP